jgi:hypothetical protein
MLTQADAVSQLVCSLFVVILVMQSRFWSNGDAYLFVGRPLPDAGHAPAYPVVHGHLRVVAVVALQMIALLLSLVIMTHSWYSPTCCAGQDCKPVPIGTGAVIAAIVHRSCTISARCGSI